MDFRNSSNQPAQPGRTVNPGQPAAPAPHTPNDQKDKKSGRFMGIIPGWLRVANIVLLFSVTILIVAVIFVLRANNPNQSQYVMKDDYQAIFLDNGQVYFGKIASLNSQYIDLQNVFYLNSQSQTDTDAKTTTAQDTNFTLIKLGCELHGPYNQMIINTDKVTFWENIRDDGQVSKTIEEWIKQNPDGQKCSESTNSTDQSTSTTEGATGTTSNTTNTGTTNKESTSGR